MKTTLAIDLGNTSIKAAVFNGGQLLETFRWGEHHEKQINDLFLRYPVTHSILSTVGKEQEGLQSLLDQKTDFMLLTPETRLPFENKYATPSTLGMDRVAAVAGAISFFPACNCLLVDAGTCITYDFINADKIYTGGAISPGLRMRLQAMNTFTASLPLPEFHIPADFIGSDTVSCLIAGAWYGVIGEINEMVNRYEARFGKVQVITCGGDSALFDKHIKSDIFAAPFLVLHGLNQILEFNAS